MRNAPSVSYPVGRCAFQAYVLALTVLAGALAWVLWQWLSWAPPGWLGGLGAGLWLLWAFLAWRSWKLAPIGQLRWDANASADPVHAGSGRWSWLNSDAASVQWLAAVQPMLDAQGVMLLRLTALAGPSRWIWVGRAHDPARWDDLRRALRAHAI